MNRHLVRAAQYATQGNIDGLFDLFYDSKDIFIDIPKSSFTSALSIVLFLLPEYIDPRLYAGRVHDLFINPQNGKSFDESFDDIELPEEHLEARSRGIEQFIREQSGIYGWTNSDGSYASWVKIRMKLIDSTGAPLRYFEEFNNIQSVAYCTGIVAVVVNYSKYFNDSTTLDFFDRHAPEENIEFLLRNTTSETIQRDVENLVVPYLEYSCDDLKLLNQWVSKVNKLQLLVPLSSLPQLTSSILSACYSNDIDSPKMWNLLTEIGRNLNLLDLPDIHENETRLDLSQISTTWLVSPASSNAVTFFQNIVNNGKDISEIVDVTLIDVVRVRFGNEKVQQNLVDRLVSAYENKRKQSYWALKELLISLKKDKLLNLVSETYLEEQLLSSSLKAGHFEFARKLQSNVSSFKPLALNAFEKFVDEASSDFSPKNMKNAANCLELLAGTKWSGDDDVKRANALIQAINKFFNLITNSKQRLPTKLADLKLMDPFELAGSVLELNSRAYQKFDQLRDMTEDFIYGVSYSVTDKIDTPSIKILAMCVDAALANNDFSTAYQYCVPRLSQLHNSQVAWTACFQVGKYVSAYWEETPPVSVFADQMFILSCALEICPSDNISQIIEVWKRLEKLSKTTNYSSMILQEQAGSGSSSSLGRQSLSPQPETARKRDQISNLLVSGLGWAIGANQTR